MAQSKKLYTLYIVLFSFLGLLILFVGILAVNTFQYESTLLKEGVRVDAQVFWLEQQTTRKGKVKKSYVDLAIFTKGTAKPEKEKVTNTDAIDDKIDAIFKNTSLNNNFGDYESVRKEISLEGYGMLEIGDRLTYVYIAGEIEKGNLLMSLE